MKNSSSNIVKFLFTSGVLLLGFDMAATGQTSASSDAQAFVLTVRGSHDEVRAGTPAERYWKNCAIDAEPSHPTSADPELRGPTCMKLMLLWGEALASDGSDVSDADRARQTDRPESYDVEHERGRSYIQKSLELLSSDLDNLQGKQLDRRLEIHRTLEMQLHWHAVGVFPGDLAAIHAAAVNYYLRVWNALPDRPSDFKTFRYKFDTGEDLKQIFYDITYKDELPRLPDGVEIAAGFFRQAYEFHRVRPPDPGDGSAPKILGAHILDEMYSEGLGYGMYPGDHWLSPLFPLARTDVQFLLRYLKAASAAKLVDATTVENDIETTKKWSDDLQIAELKAWSARWHQRNDFLGEAEIREKLVGIYSQQGNAVLAVAEQEELCNLLLQTGDRLAWTMQMVELSKLRAAAKQWTQLLSMLPPVQQNLLEFNEFNSLLETIQYQQLAWQTLGMKPDIDWDAKLKPWLDDLKTMPELDSKILSEADVSKFRNWLNQQGHLASIRYSARLELAHALTDNHMYADAEQLTRELISESGPIGCKDMKYGLLKHLLEIESARGNLGEFYSTFDQYQQLGHELHGENWLQTDGLPFAQVFYGLHDFPRAESVLAAQEEREMWELLRDSRLRRLGIDGVREEDLMLQTKIDLERGRTEIATKRGRELEKYASQAHSGAVTIQGEVNTRLEILYQLAQLVIALGNPEPALNYAQQILKATDPLKDTDRWVRAKIIEAHALLELRRDASDDIKKFQELAPHFTEYKELGAQLAVDMDIMIADWNTANHNSQEAVAWLDKALKLANELGAIDSQLEIHRKLGDSALAAKDIPHAVREYRSSMSLLTAVSETIPSDLGKVGYRGERNQAVSRLAVTLYDLYRTTGSSAYIAEMFQAVEQGKARALAEMVFGRDDSALQDFGVADVQRALPLDAMLLEYYTPQGTRDAVFRFQIDHEKVSVVALPISASRLAGRVQSLLQEAINSSDSYDEQTFRQMATELGRILLPEDFDRSRKPQLIIVPSGPLYLFPFSLLAGANGRFIDEGDVSISYLPNAAFLVRDPPRLSDLKRAAGFGNPAGEREQAASASKPELRDALAQAFHNWAGGSIVWEQTLTPRQFLEHALQTDHMFLYSHATFLPEDPISSYIKLSPDVGDEGNLSAARLLQQKIGHGLWVLAACSTGSGDVQSGDEVLGLPRALLQAGASSVVVSLWEVDQVWSMRLMTDFYHNLATGMPTSKALHLATNGLRQAGRPPFDWAPFILTGHYGFRD